MSPQCIPVDSDIPTKTPVVKEFLFWLTHKAGPKQCNSQCKIPFKCVLIEPGDNTWKHVQRCVPATETGPRRVRLCSSVCVCVFLPSLKCALGLCVSMHMNVFPLCGCLLFLAEQSEMSKADKFQKDEEKAEIECARTNSAMLF